MNLVINILRRFLRLAVPATITLIFLAFLSSADVIKTKKGNEISHQHLVKEDFEKGTAEVESFPANGKPAKENMLIETPKSKDQLVKQAQEQKFGDVKAPTFAYNCHGLTFAKSKVWITDVRKILDDQDWKPAKDNSQNPITSENNQGAKKGDILIYGTTIGTKDERIEHNAVVEEVDDKGKITKVRSKLGEGVEAVHDPNFDGIEEKTKKRYQKLYGTWVAFRGGEPLDLKDPPPEDSQEFSTFGIRDTCGSLDPDSDSDGLPDLKEIFWDTDEANPDSDGDGFTDGLEVFLGFNPLDPRSAPKTPGIHCLLTRHPIHGDANSAEFILQKNNRVISLLTGSISITVIQNQITITGIFITGSSVKVTDFTGGLLFALNSTRPASGEFNRSSGNIQISFDLALKFPKAPLPIVIPANLTGKFDPESRSFDSVISGVLPENAPLLMRSSLFIILKSVSCQL